MSIYVGTSGWSYPKGGGRWDGVFYPEDVQDRDKLAFYAQYFDAVEINNTFYRPPSPYAARAWAQKTPSNFRFTAKLWQKFTHPKMFEEATGQEARVQDEDFGEFTRGLEPLVAAGKLGPVLAQFPPSFKPEPGSIDYLEDLVRRFRSQEFQLAVELRHRDWTASEEASTIRTLLEDEGVAWVMIDEPHFRTSIRDIPLTSHALAYFRFHGRNYANWWRHDQAEDRYNYFYTAEEQQELSAEVREVSQQAGTTYAFYNNHYGAKAVVNALQLEMSLGLPGPRAPLPATLVAQFEDLAELAARTRPS